MPELSVPFVNQVSAQRNAEQQAQQQQQVMQMAHWSLIAKQRQEAEQDREFKSLVGIAADGDFPDDMRLQAINKVGPKLGLTGQVTIDGLRPMSTLLSKMQKTHEAGGDLSVFQPAIDMISANIRLISPSQMPQFADLASQANEARVNKAVDFSNPVTPDVQEAMDRVEGRKADLTDLRSQADRYQANAANGASPTVQREAVGMLDQLRQMEDDDVRDQTIIKGDTVRQTRNQQIATMVRRDPRLLAEIEKNGLAKAGVVPFDANGLASQYYALASKEPDTLTQPEQRKLVVLESLGVAKGLKDRTTAVAASALTAQWQQAKVDADGLSQTITADHEAQETANTFAPALEDILTRGKTGPLDETSWNRLHQDAKTQSEAMGTAKLQAVQAAAPKVQALTEEYQTLSQQEKALREQAAMVPASRRAELLAKADGVARLMEAKQAESDLLTTYHPLEKQEHEWTLKLHEMNAEQLKAALQSENLSPEKRAELQKEYDASNATADTERKFLDGWTTKRQRALLIVNKTQLQLQKEADALKARATTLNASLEKEEQTNLLTRSILTDLGDGKTLTQALSENKNSFGSADIKKVIEDVKTLTAMDESRAIGTAQDAFAALVAGHKGDLTPQVEAGYAQKAAGIAKKQTGIAPKIEDVLKGLPRQQAGVTVNLPPQEHQEAKTVGEGFGKKYIAIQDAAILANNKISKLDRMESLMQGVQTGKLTPALAQVQAIAEAFGFRVDPKLGAMQALDSLTNEVALELRNPSGGAGMPGALSDKDREFLMSMPAGLNKTPEGNKLIIDTARSIAKRDQEVAKLARDYRKKHGSIDEGFYDALQSYADEHPLFKGQAAPVSPTADSKGIPTIQNDADYNALPSGTIFMSPDGQKRKKP